MASSDDEGETFSDTVSDYDFCDEKDEPLPFSKLAVQWNESESTCAYAGLIFLKGTVDNGLRKFYQQVKAWKYDFLTDKPEISVLSKDNHWIKLQKPRKSYISLIRSILITVHSLCFFKRKPEASGKSLWDHLSNVFSVYDVRPSENDLIDHMNFIREAVKRDETLENSQFLATLLDNPRKKKSRDENVVTATKPSFIVDDNDMNDEPQDDDFITKQTEESESDEEDDHFDSVCAICDNGGVLTCCEGKCFRSFHANGDSEEAKDSNCESLCLTREELEGTKHYKCENCQYNLHQCFVCNKLGSSDKSSNTEVFRCSAATCGHFYHPQCVAKLILKIDKAEQQALKEKIAAGDPFICPAHKCAACKQTENEKVEDLQFAICRRCPTSYHRKCLPRDIMFGNPNGDNGYEVRAWDGLLSKSRALIYCIKHEISEDIDTPERIIIFRNILRKRTSLSEPLKNKKKMVVNKTGGDPIHSSKKSLIKSQIGDKKSSEVKLESSFKKRAAVSSGSDSLKRKKVSDTSKNPLRRNLSTKVKKPSLNDDQPSLGSRLFDLITESNNLEKDVTSVDENKQITVANSLPVEISPPVDDESKQRIMALMKEAAASVTLDSVKKSYQGKVPSTHAHSSRVDKSIILARVEGSVEALHLALKKLEEGCSVEDAMAVCDPAVIYQLLRWKNKLKVYLAPFLHGMRYTSFGRHFTKVEKLEKIVDKLQWYIEDGDTVVDFCCGANDFSCLIKKRLEETGKKKCSYKNFDITPPKNDFNFEKRDWMSVATKELPPGRKLIMGLNPPFGKNASLANQFIDKALRFKPKLIILIAPSETERLDSERKSTRYDLIWEDVELLAGKSFYLPGSVDTSDKQMDQWNNIAPPLYLWSHPAWTNEHKSIAQKHGHIPKIQQSDKNVLVTNEIEVLNLPVVNKVSEQITDKANAKPEMKKRKKESSVRDNNATETKKKPIVKSEKPNQKSTKRNHQNQEFKTEKRDSSHENQAQKHDKTRNPSCELEPQKFEKTCKIETQRREKTREAEILKHEKNCEVETRHVKTQVPSRETEAQKLNSKHSSPHETLYSDFSFANDLGQQFDQHMESKYSSIIDESAFSLTNVIGHPCDQPLERRNNPVIEEPYYNRRLDVSNNVPTSSYLTRTDPVQYSGYDRVGRGSYFDEMSSRNSSYSTSNHEPGLTRYGSVDTTVNRSSTSAMQRYAPRLDELNHTRGNNLGRVEPLASLANRGTGGYGQPLNGPGFHSESLGFAPGPYNPYSYHNSSGGWLNE